jgi:hypothetical protein
MPYSLACARAGISEDSLSAWRKKGAEGKEPYASFAEELKRAEGDAVFMRLQHIEGAAINGQWQASAWLLERRYPEHFGRKDRLQAEVTGKDGGPVQSLGLAMSLEQLQDPDVRNLAAQLAARMATKAKATDADLDRGGEGTGE